MTLHSTSFVPRFVSREHESLRSSGIACARRRPRGLSVALTCIQRAIAVLVGSTCAGGGNGSSAVGGLMPALVHRQPARGRRTTVHRVATLLASGCLLASAAPAVAATHAVSNEAELRNALSQRRAERRHHQLPGRHHGDHPRRWRPSGGGDQPHDRRQLAKRSTAAVRTAGCSSMPARSRSTTSPSPIRWPRAAMAATAAAAPGLAGPCSCGMAPL